MARQELTQVGAFTSEVRDKIQTALQTAEARTPASSSAAGVAGQICYDATYIYVCLAANTWCRITPTTTSF
jgi:hypothetical protein